jgi:hypothetical protein
MSRRPQGFVKERKTRKGGFKNCQSPKVGVLHKVPIPLTGKKGVIFQVVRVEQIPAAIISPKKLFLSRKTPRRGSTRVFARVRRPKATITDEGLREPDER